MNKLVCALPVPLLIALVLGVAISAEATSNNRAFGEQSAFVDISGYKRFNLNHKESKLPSKD